MTQIENIKIKNFDKKKPSKKIKSLLNKLIREDNHIIKSLKNNYKDSWDIKKIQKYKNFSNITLVGMGGSIMGSKSIYSFLKNRIKKNFFFLDNFENNKIKEIKKKNNLNLIISKSGNTLETIVNSNVIINKKVKNIFITENNENYLRSLAIKLKSDIIDHNNFIGGRYSVLSEVGMLPAILMGLKVEKFRKFNELIKNKFFLNSIINSVSSTISLIKRNKLNSIILNYDEKSSDLFYWYQQLVAESLGKKGRGILPIISKMPQDNHSLMQLYLDGTKNNFYTFFFTKEILSEKIKNEGILKSRDYLKHKNLQNVLYNQFLATQSVFSKKKIPFRSFVVEKRDESSLGILFTYFILETILLGKVLKINPYDQPSVELIKKETKKKLISNNYF
ncbi:glucose-6-phosphate isomerase [Candidatus Pelagibacter sp.]|uniref:glucose-6-phosphate isomerase n=1 Tax=Candidatus Pelagibacter sp. TaxID=2024849 RepID=UPI003F83A722